jgi:hypothetical protein
VDGVHDVGRLGRGVDEPRARGGQRLADRVGARGHLGPGDADADPDLAARVVQTVPIAPDDGHREGHGARAYPWIGSAG